MNGGSGEGIQFSYIFDQCEVRWWTRLRILQLAFCSVLCIQIWKMCCVLISWLVLIMEPLFRPAHHLKRAALQQGRQLRQVVIEMVTQRIPVTDKQPVFLLHDIWPGTHIGNERVSIYEGRCWLYRTADSKAAKISEGPKHNVLQVWMDLTELLLYRIPGVGIFGKGRAFSHGDLCALFCCCCLQCSLSH